MDTGNRVVVFLTPHEAKKIQDKISRLGVGLKEISYRLNISYGTFYKLLRGEISLDYGMAKKIIETAAMLAKEKAKEREREAAKISRLIKAIK